MSREADSVAPATPWVVIPAYNEAPRLAGVLDAVARALPGAPRIVVDDGSSDSTADVARASGATVLRHRVNLGYGASLQTGYKHCLRRGAELVAQLDADGQHDPAWLHEMIELSRREHADVVLGSRFAAAGDYPMGWQRNLGRRLFVWYARRNGLAISDPTTGLQVLRRPALELYARDFFPRNYPDVDVLLVAHRNGLRVVEHPVTMRVADRASLLHGGLRSIYYLYRLGVSLWAGTKRIK